MTTALFLAYTLLSGILVPAIAQERSADEAGALKRQIEVVRRELAQFGAVVEYAPNTFGEIVSRKAFLETGRDLCEWIIVTDHETLRRKVSAKHYRSTKTFALAALDPARITASPVKERPWCCERSAEVAFATVGERQVIRSRLGSSWYVSARAWLNFTDAGAAQRAAAALAEAVRLCRRPGA